MQPQIAPEPPLPTSPQALLARLDSLGIAHKVYRHEPVFTVAESEHLKAHIPGLHCRNLFVRDKKETMFLVVVPNDTQIDLKKLPDLLGCGRLSFGSPDRLWRYLGVRPGSVCPFAIINDKDHDVTIVLDQRMMEADLVCYHPLENNMSITITPAGLLKFIESCGHKPHILGLDI